MKSTSMKTPILDHQPVDVFSSTHQPEAATLKRYVIGYVGSLILTISAYSVVRYGIFNKYVLMLIIGLLALIQFVLQLNLFLHVGKEFSPKLKLLVMSFMLLIVFILVGGSLWIMYSLNNRMMPTTAQEIKYMNSQGNL